jgi:hypothetical protein
LFYFKVMITEFPTFRDLIRAVMKDPVKYGFFEVGIRAACEELGVSRQRIHQMTSSGLLDVIVVAGHPLLSSRQLHRYKTSPRGTDPKIDSSSSYA